MKKLISLILLLSCLISLSQERIGSFKNDLKKGQSYVYGIIPIVNSKKDDLTIFIRDTKKIYGYKINDKFEVTSKVIKDRNRKYTRLISSLSDENENYLFIYSDYKKNTFVVEKTSFKTGKTEKKQHKIDIDFFNQQGQTLISKNSSFDKLVFLESVNLQDKTHLIFIKKPSSTLVIVSFDTKGNYTTDSIDLSEVNFLTTDNEACQLSELMYVKRKGSGVTDALNTYYKTFKTIEGDNRPISFQNASYANKLFIKNDNLTFTFDKNKNYTQVLKLNLNSKEYSFEKFKKPFFNETKKKTNSFLIEDNILALGVTNDTLSLNIYNLSDKKLIKNYAFSSEEEITFKNTSMFQKGSTYGNRHKQLKTAQFLKKMYLSNVGVLIQKRNENYETTFMSIKPTPSQVAMPGGLPIGSFNNGDKSVNFKSIFDKNFNHIEGEIEENKYDKINSFLYSKNDLFGDDNMNSTEILDFNNQCILISYDGRTKMVYFYKF